MVNPKIKFNYLDISLITKKSLLFTSIFLVIEFITLLGVYRDTISEYDKRVDVICKTEGKDINLICNTLFCKGVVDNNQEYINTDGILQRTSNQIDINKRIFFLNKDLDTVLEKDGTYYIIDNRNTLHFIYTITFMSTLTFFIIMLTMAYRVRVTEKKKDVYEKAILRNDLETRLQRDITESLHHEMGTPLAIIRTLTMELFKNMYPCEVTRTGMCDLKMYKKEIKECSNCPANVGMRREFDKKALSYYDQIMLASDSLYALQTLVGKGKHINYSNGTTSIFEIVNNVIASSNGFRVRKVTPHFKNKEILDMYSCRGLANGELLIIVNSMILNSIEAKSTCIEVSACINKDTMELFIRDNGSGVRDVNDKVVTDYGIFNYGYSTKNKSGENIQVKGLFNKILNKLNLYNKQNQERGAGLSISKRMLQKSNGDIMLLGTSKNGTTFKVIIPIKVTDKSILKSQYS